MERHGRDTQPIASPQFFRIVKRQRLGPPVLSGVIHQVREEKDGELIALCGVTEWGGDGLSIMDGPATCERCQRATAYKTLQK